MYNLHAQDFKFGLKGGINYGTPGDLLHLGALSGSGPNVDPVDDFMYEAEYSLSYHFGAYASYGYKKFYVRPEINYLKLDAAYSLAYKEAEWKYEKIELPILVGYKITKPLSFYAGPVFNFSNEISLDGVEPPPASLPVEYDESTLGFAFGINYEFNRIGIDLRYEYDTFEYEEHRIDMYRAEYGTNVAYLQSYNLSQIMLSININLIELGPNSKRKKGKFPWNNIKCN